MLSPPPPFFNDAIDLKVFRASKLLDFLEASLILRAARLWITSDITQMRPFGEGRHPPQPRTLRPHCGRWRTRFQSRSSYAMPFRKIHVASLQETWPYYDPEGKFPQSSFWKCDHSSVHEKSS